MVSNKAWLTVNISLALVALLLALNLFEVEFPTVGKVQFMLDGEEPLIAVETVGELSLMPDLGRGCLMTRQQLKCDAKIVKSSFGRLDWECQTGNGPIYRLNNKAYFYCQDSEIWRKW